MTVSSDEAGKHAGAGASRYDLCVRDGPRRLVWRFRDPGITVSPEGLTWIVDGSERKKPFADIAAIRLETASIPRSGYFGACAIAFRDGGLLTVNSLGERGLPDDRRIAPYVAFVRDLHARLSPDDRQRIRFLAGSTEARYRLGIVAAVLAGSFFVILPLVLLAITGESKALFLTLSGTFFVYPVIRTLRRNEPRTYRPDSLTDDLFP